MGLVPQVVPQTQLAEAQASIQAGGDGVRDGIAALLKAVAEHMQREGAGGVNCAQVLAAAMRRLTEDPYLTLGVEPESDEVVIKKAYRKLALRYHPDKNKATSSLFQAVQGAYDILSEPDKRAEYDNKRKRQQEALSRLRKHPKPSGSPTRGKDATTKATDTSSASTSAGGSSRGRSTRESHSFDRTRATAAEQQGANSKKPRAAPGYATSSEEGATSGSKRTSGEEKVRQFNKRFYEEFRRETKKNEKANANKSGAVPTQEPSHQPPARPKMRSTSRTDSTVTLEWHCGGLPSTTAYELQWRQRGRGTSDWVTSPTLVVGNSCRKKNLEPCTCYEFRVRAASAWGWSSHCDPVMVVTLPLTDRTGSHAGGASGAGSSATPRQKVSGFQSDGIGGSAAGKAGAQDAFSRDSAPKTHESHRSDKCAPEAGGAGETKEGRAGDGPGLEKTNSWYWRRMSRAAAQEGSADPAAKDKPQRRRTAHGEGNPSEGAWACVVCKRNNEPASNSCWVCYTPRTDNDTAPRRPNSTRKESTATRCGPKAAPTESTKEGAKVEQPPSSGRSGTSGKDNRAETGLNDHEAGIRVSDKVPSIRVYSVPNQDGLHDERTKDAGGIRVRSASTSDKASARTKDHHGPEGPLRGEAADVWEFTDGDLDNVGTGPTEYGSDDDWSYASGACAIDTRSDPGDRARYRRKSSTAAAQESSQDRARKSASGPSSQGGTGTDTSSRRRFLDERITKLHNVRAEPIKDAEVVGFLTAAKEVEVVAEVGDWYKVRWHKRAKKKGSPDSASSDPPQDNSTPAGKTDRSSDNSPPEAAVCGDATEETGEARDADVMEDSIDDVQEKGCGWCLTRDSKHKYIVTIEGDEARPDFNRRPLSASNTRRKAATGRRRSSIKAGVQGDFPPPGGRDGDDDVDDDVDEECWHELKDEDGSVYYFNTSTGVSQWEPPLWLDEIDPTTGAVYYVNCFSGEPQWERPSEYVPILRENPYDTTPEQEFIKSVLSPKRSKGPKSFHESMRQAANKTPKASSAKPLRTVTEGECVVRSEGERAVPASTSADGSDRDGADAA